MPVIETTDLSKTYRSGWWGRRTIRALDGVTLRVDEGEVFALLGQNGAGKSTLVSLLLGLRFPTGGRARVLGRSPTDPALKHRVGFLPEEDVLPPRLTSRQVLHSFGQMSGVATETLRARVPDLIDEVGLSGRADERLDNYSKGMKRRLALAQALLHAPRLLFLDEPTGGLDPSGRRWMRQLLLRLRERGTTIFLNSHVLAEVEQVADRIGVLRDGRLVADTTPGTLTDGGARSLEDAVLALTAPHDES